MSMSRSDEEYEVERHHEFIYIDSLSDDKIGIIYDGELAHLDINVDIKDIFDYNQKVINKRNIYDLKYYNNTNDYSFLLIYKKNNESKYIFEKIILLIKKMIRISEVYYVTGKHCGYEDDGELYCKYYFNSLIKISENNFIISFKSRIKSLRDICYFYITYRNYKNETIF